MFLFMLGRPVQVARCCRGLLMLSLNCSLTSWVGLIRHLLLTSTRFFFTSSYSWVKCFFSSMEEKLVSIIEVGGLEVG